MDAFPSVSEAGGVVPKAEGEIAPDTSSNHADDLGCRWCGALMPVGRRRGSARRFCRTEHRTAFHSAARRYVNQAIAAGRLTVAQMHAPGKACTPQPGACSAEGATPLAKMDRSHSLALVRILWAIPLRSQQANGRQSPDRKHDRR